MMTAQHCTKIREAMDVKVVPLLDGINSSEWSEVVREAYPAIPSTHCNEGNTNVTSALVMGFED